MAWELDPAVSMTYPACTLNHAPLNLALPARGRSSAVRILQINRKVRDIYQCEGYFDFTPRWPYTTTWVPILDNVAIPDWLETLRRASGSPPIPEHLHDYNSDYPIWERPVNANANWTRPERQRALKAMQHLRGRTILLVGDSVDRNFVMQFGYLLQADRVAVRAYDGSVLVDADHFSYLERYKTLQMPHWVVAPGVDVNLTVTNVFAYGVIDHGPEFGSFGNLSPPLAFADRVESLFLPYTQSLQSSIALIQFSQGCKFPIQTLAMWLD